jgi:nucleotide-binding universal stress UspA family protein
VTSSSSPVPPSGPIRRIVVAYDGSESSARAVRFALGASTGEQRGVWIVHASDPPMRVAEPRPEEEQQYEAAAIEQSLRAIQEASDPGGRWLHVTVREGKAAPVILAAANEVDADMIVLGTRGLRGASRLVLGSVSTEVLARSGRPVAVVP